ncbi:MAG TPA: hypothetical protein VH274_05880, partial [Mycobacteriales bacterium]|nr:hypothetical protein [Mycobacteriales bacterium]
MNGRHAVQTAAALAALIAASSCSGGKPVANHATPASGGTMHGTFSETGPRGHLTAGESAGTSDSGAVKGAAPEPAGAAGSATGTGLAASGNNNIQVGLRAGSVDDNARFTDYLTYRDAFTKQDIRTQAFDVSERHIFTVTTPSGDPVVGADIAILDQQGNKASELRTYADGRALWFPRTTDVGDAQQFTAVVSKGSASTSVDVDRHVLEHSISLDTDPSF